MKYIITSLFMASSCFAESAITVTESATYSKQNRNPYDFAGRQNDDYTKATETRILLEEIHNPPAKTVARAVADLNCSMYRKCEDIERIKAEEASRSGH